MENYFFTILFFFSVKMVKSFFFTYVWPMIFFVVLQMNQNSEHYIVIDNGGHIISRATFVSLKALLQCFFKDMRGGMN